MIERRRYMEWLDRWRDEAVTKVVTGLRRCGKSSVFELYRQRLLASGIDERNVIAINFESLDEEYPTEAVATYNYIKERLRPGRNYVFLDEVQHVRDFERLVDGLVVRDDVDLYITGSNAYFLSSELATLLTGRYVELRMLPFSFEEYLAAMTEYASEGEPVSADSAFERFLTYGGMPFTAHLTDEQSISDYLGGVFNTIVMSDAAARHPRMDMRSFLDTAAFLADNVGNISSLKRISGGLKASGRSASPTAVGEYVMAMTENYLMFKAGRYDVKGGEHLATLEKYYLGDLGFRFWLLGKTQGDIACRLENAVYLELLRRYRMVSVGKAGVAEVDFVTSDDHERRYFQVAMTVLDEATLERELAPLRAIADNYPKTLLTLDRIGLGNFEGIEHRNVMDWLLD